ncbi:BZ3500_MvSof-1268-A1-R1_Chr9g10678 [Microbotryum saponariae]|uniref:BZ3500_MvSof-1268-A1-R1_Chr9g10678 protein n=1 Tax=Microbotryum saponariae TaxID=289078 RepID=A0A2X0N6T0_9BASI|nr:BZ3501_MvSof-1269-A2-R1_Chr9g10426 [Microbotryum saponariae]SDA00507.1 BZ3500_MvSof-1268-A1-R1_Chr9g10678 [Microbotryum saponariae]
MADSRFDDSIAGQKDISFVPSLICTSSQNLKLVSFAARDDFSDRVLDDRRQLLHRASVPASSWRTASSRSTRGQQSGPCPPKVADERISGHTIQLGEIYSHGTVSPNSPTFPQSVTIPLGRSFDEGKGVWKVQDASDLFQGLKFVNSIATSL